MNIDIVQLVLSLTPVEKQYFKKAYASHSEFVILFDFINKYKSYDTSKFKEYLIKKRKSYSKKISNYSPGHLSVIKSYLHEKIMESLRTQYVPQRTSYDLMIKSLNADILLEKGLYQLAKKEISKAKKKALHQSFPIEKLMLYRRDSIIQFYEDYAHSSQKEINDLYEQRINTAEQLLLEIKYAQVLTNLTYSYFKGEKERTNIESIMESELMLDETKATDFAPKYLFNWIHAQFADYQNKPAEAISFFEKTILTWLEYPDYIQGHPRMYLGTCYTYLRYILQQKQIESMVLKKKDFTFLLEQIPKLKLNQDMAKKWKQLFMIGELSSLYNDHNYDAIIKQTDSFLNISSSQEGTTDFMKIITIYFISSSYFKKNDFNTANNLLHPLINDNNLNLNSSPEYKAPLFFQYLMTLFELKDYKFLQIQGKKIRKRLMEENTFSPFDSLVLKMFSQLSIPRFEGQSSQVFIRFEDRLMEELNRRNEINTSLNQFIMNWIAQKKRHFNSLV